MTKRGIHVGIAPVPVNEDRFFVDMLSDSYTPEARGRMHAKDAGWCQRKNYLHSKEADTTHVMDAASQLYMGIGNGIEEALAGGLHRQGRLFFNNLRVPPMTPDIGGLIDLVYLDRHDRIVIAEVKSCGQLPVAPRPEHMNQLLTYHAVAGYDAGHLVYVSRTVRSRRGDVMIRSFESNADKDAMLAQLEVIAYSQLCIDNDVLPDIPFFLSKSKCQYCPFIDRCWGDDIPDIGLNIDRLLELREEAKTIAANLYDERPKRLVASLRHLYRNVANKDLKPRIISEIEKYEKF